MAAGRDGVAASQPKFLSLLLMLLALTALQPLFAAPAQAQIGSDRYSSIVVDAATGRVLSAVNPDEQRHPASLTKMMTLYMVFEAMRDRRISLHENVPVSAHAASMEPTKLDLLPTTRITVEEAILGIVTKSANDAASALGEMLGGGDEDRFAQMMTLRARALGMTHTMFRNASGLPDPDQWSTARDMALLGRHLLQDFPVEYRYFSTPAYRFHGRQIVGHDNMLKSYLGTDGIKTGYTDASGFNMVTSAVRSNVRLIGVVFGAAHAGERDIHMASILDQGFEQLDVMPPPRHAPGLGLVPTVSAATLPPRPPAAQMGRIGGWLVQVGAFGNQAIARDAAATARRYGGSGDIRIERAPGTKPTWRAQLTGLNEAEARGTCASLAKHKQACTIMRAETGQLASR
jgi:D-alanyl-D-alanine carboxypeptidase